MGAEPMLECEVRTYLEALQEMVTSAKVAASTLQTAVARIRREEEPACGGAASDGQRAIKPLPSLNSARTDGPLRA